MNRPFTHRWQLVTTILLLAAFVPLAAAHAQQQPVIVQPGAPGEPSREISAAEASDLAGILFTQADVEFMRGMIVHHSQALDMTALVAERSQSDDLQELAQRIELSQKDEIEMMQEWLRSHGQPTSDPDVHAAHGDHARHLMPGMLTAEQMAQLAGAHGGEFDRLFLELMMQHHRGALVMVDDLLEKPGAAQESAIFGFTTDITADQSAEIERMASMLAGLSSDPRVGLAPGLHDAGQAAWNLELVTALPKPPGFFAPEAPEGLPVPEMKEDEEDEGEGEELEGEEEIDPERARELKKKKARADMARIGAVLNFANSDLAFKGDALILGNFHGFNTYDISDPTAPRLLGSVVCPGGQGDVSVVGNLLVLSVEQTRGRLDCGLQGVAEPSSSERFRGVRIYDISDLTHPRQVAAVQTCRGSHTHTVVTDPDDEGNIYVYGSGTSSVRPGDELSGCSDAPPGEDENTALFSIDVIQIPVARPEEARVVSRPRVFADPDTGAIAGLWRGGRHGTGTQKTSETDQCHDITVYPELGLAAGACSGNGILLDISDPAHPVRLDQVTDASFAYWHSATFNNDGTKVIFTDEWGGGLRPRCRASDPKHWGADAIFDIVDRKLVFRGYYKMPAPQTEVENCVAHNGSLVPVPGRDIMVQAWYQGGLSVFDFTDSAHPVEIAFFDRGPIDGTRLMMGGYWSTYWDNGFIYGSEIARGLDVLRLLPSEVLSRNEIDAAALIHADLVNAQHQRRIEWPASPVVALAYVDQLERSAVLGPEEVDSLRQALEDAAGSGSAASADRARAATQLDSAAARLADISATGRDEARLRSLGATIEGIVDRLR